jgi:hypothetical protein
MAENNRKFIVAAFAQIRLIRGFRSSVSFAGLRAHWNEYCEMDACGDNCAHRWQSQSDDRPSLVL